MCPRPQKPPVMAMPVPVPKQELASSSLLELAAADDLVAFRSAVQEDTLSLVAASSWYGPSARGPARLALELRTPAMVAALYGSTAVLSYVLSIAPSEAARASATDGATSLHLAAAGGAASSLAATHLLLAAGASPDAQASTGLRAGDLLPRSTPADKPIRLQLKSPAASPSSSPTHNKKEKEMEREREKEEKEYGHPELPDLKSGVFCTDEFRMYSFKVKPCSRAYTHDWTECPFAHPGENARRRDPRRFSYTCVPCPEFRKAPAACRKGDACEYAHGVFESWLHPAQYRTRLCKDEVGCPRRICFFAHRPEELRVVNPSAVSVAMPSPCSSSPPTSTPSGLDMARVAMLSASRPVLKASLSSRELDFDLDQYKHKLLLGYSAAAAPSPLAPRTAPDYSDLLASVSQLQALALKQAGDINNMPAYSCLPEAQMHSAHRPPPCRPMVGSNTGHSIAKAIMGSRTSAFAKRSQSFVDRTPAVRSFVSPAPTSVLSDWGSPDGKLDWSVQGAELRKSASFGIRRAQTTNNTTPDVSWVSSLVKDGSDLLAAAHWSDLEQMVA